MNDGSVACRAATYLLQFHQRALIVASLLEVVLGRFYDPIDDLGINASLPVAIHRQHRSLSPCRTADGSKTKGGYTYHHRVRHFRYLDGAYFTWKFLGDSEKEVCCSFLRLSEEESR